MLLLSAEYRYEVNPFLMAAVFYDAGQVAQDWSVFTLKDMRDNYGFGLRFGSSTAVALRADLAILSRRAKLISLAITFCTTTALLVCTVIATMRCRPSFSAWYGSCGKFTSPR